MSPSELTARALAWLPGRWHGTGAGSYPHVADFAYAEELHIDAADGWPMLHVTQRTWRLVDDTRGAGLHLETGLLQAQPDGALLYSCGQDSGRVEVMRGEVRDDGATLTIAWDTTAHGHDPRLVRAGRIWTLTADTLHYQAFIATVRTPTYRPHLTATLSRAPTLAGLRY